jgi:DNA-binding response OmpR family regulator
VGLKAAEENLKKRLMAIFAGARRMFQFGEFRLDLRERRFTRGSSEIPLPPKAFDLLALFVTHSGELLTKEARDCQN